MHECLNCNIVLIRTETNFCSQCSQDLAFRDKLYLCGWLGKPMGTQFNQLEPYLMGKLDREGIYAE